MRATALLFVFAAAASAQVISVTPERAPAGEPVRVSVRGLEPGQAAIVRASARDADGTEWQSWAGFVADRNGRIEVSERAPAHGSYEGAEAMGLFWSMDVAGEDHGRKRFNTARMETVAVRLDLDVAGTTVHSAVAVRQLLPPRVTRSEVRTGPLVGTLFMPERPRGAILVLGGSEGGIGDETLAALLAGHGYAALALAYFGEPPLPKALADVPLETFFAAIGYLEGRVSPPFARVAIAGTSKGAEAALLVASHRRDVAGVIAFAPSSVVWSCICDEPRSSWSLQGEPVPFVPPGRDPTYVPPRGFPLEPAVHYRYRLKRAAAGARIDVANIAAPLLLIAGIDDRLWPSAEMARQIAERRAGLPAAARDAMLLVPGAGHLIGKAYLPSGSTRTGNGRLETGGTPAANGRSTSLVWPAILRLLEGR